MISETEPGCDCMERTDGYLCEKHLEEERLIADFGGSPDVGDEEVDLPW